MRATVKPFSISWIEEKSPNQLEFCKQGRALSLSFSEIVKISIKGGYFVFRLLLGLCSCITYVHIASFALSVGPTAKWMQQEKHPVSNTVFTNSSSLSVTSEYFWRERGSLPSTKPCENILRSRKTNRTHLIYLSRLHRDLLER